MKIGISSLGKRFSTDSVVRWRQLTASAILGVTLAACAGLGGIAMDAPEPVKQAAAAKRAEARWAAILAGDLPTIYSFMSASSKSRLTQEDFRRRARLTGFSVAKVDSVTCEPELCKVNIVMTLDHRKMKGLPLAVTETWLLENGEYWYVWPL